ncbi:alpha/beta-type small acid-soluble spore protein [Lentibacillus lipolyticus]|nr:alpha/beta-type small acid-soluble spore protein [Lentibacillus lipolyticus]
MADNKNDLLVPGAEDVMENMKQEIANEFGVQPGADTTARENGSVGGEMVKRMLQIAESSMSNKK